MTSASNIAKNGKELEDSIGGNLFPCWVGQKRFSGGLCALSLI